MTEKSSQAGLDHGGGKTVAVLPSGTLDPAQRAALILDIADVIGSLVVRFSGTVGEWVVGCGLPL